MKASAIYITILLFLSIVLLSLPFIYVPISTSARGTIRATDENTAIVSTVSGAVVMSKLLRNNQSIHKGDTLLVIKSAGIINKKSNQHLMLSEYQAEVSDLNALLSARYGQVKTGQYRQELFAMQGKLAEVEAQLELANRELARNQLLYERRVISQSEFDKSKYAQEQLKRQKTLVSEQQMAIWEAKKKDLEQRLLTMQGGLQDLAIESENYLIKASATGRLTNFKGIREGGNIVEGQHIADISPEDDLVAACLVSPKDIGFIRINQAVNLQMDSYNYNQWGMLAASVIDIDYNVIVNEQTGASYFKVLCRLHKDHLRLGNGYKAKIVKGSSFTARFYLLERSLWQLIFDRADDWFNPAVLDQANN